MAYGDIPQSTNGSATDAEGPLATASEGLRAGAADAKQAAAEAIPAVGRLLSKTAYHTGYYLAFGVVFSAMMVARVVPTENALGAGLLDGADAARDALQQRADRLAAHAVEADAAEAGMAPA